MRQLNKRRLWLFVLAGFLGVLLLAAALNSLRNWAGIAIDEDTPEQRLALLSPDWRMVPDDAAIAEAGSVLLSGCDGVHDNMDYWGQVLAGRGYPGLIVDSHKPRDFDKLESWRLLCMGQVLPGAERAGDIATAMAESEREDVILLGASHGGWSVLEFLRQSSAGELPPGLSAWPAPARSLHDRIAAAIVIYPYCGVLNGAAEGDWSEMPPILMILAGEDELKVTPACQRMAEDLRERGADLELVLYEDAGHGFEQEERAPFSLLEFRPELREQATEEVNGFLDAHGL
ncbi:dienelactone hydrolase family protein [Paracoccus albus]|uniref:dienelactone hydrolase family protein n=1 Tax=Paracoccus albus TaxID=3017784 RepID=UPI0022EFE456|nr:dienelactone hydrolase family protein [Paracoccus albus]WBU62021.1 dienelactone hydrolase family protein [Paracoccus albus]